MIIEKKKKSDLKPNRKIPQNLPEKILVGSFPYLKVAVLFLAMFYFLDPALIGGVNSMGWGLNAFFISVLAFPHEFGHFWFNLCGDLFMGVIGGYVGQFMIPLALLMILLFMRRLYLSSFIMVWIGYNLFLVSRYMSSSETANDAVQGFLPGKGLHDWKTIFTMTGVMSKHEYYASMVYNAAIVCFAIAAIAGLLGIFLRKKNQLD